MKKVVSQKCPGARKDFKFEVRRTVWYVEAQIFTPDAADGRFSGKTCGSSSVVEFQPSKLAVAGSNPVSRSRDGRRPSLIA